MKTIPLDERLEPFKEQITTVQSRINEQLEQQRQLVKMLDDLQKGIIQNDPSYLPDEPYSLPASLQLVLMALHESLKITLAQAKTTYRELWINFSEDVESALNEEDQVINEAINGLV